MSYKFAKSCRWCSLFLFFLLFFQAVQAQGRFSETDQWMNDHLKALGGRAVLVVFKGGKLVYNRSFNHLSAGQQMAIRFIARRQGKDPVAALGDFTDQTREPIASCSKWLTAALVMTFVDQGTLHLDDTIGKFLPIFTRYHKGKITIADCLSHQTGIAGGDLRQSRELITKSHSMQESMEKIAALPVEGPPGR
ncbi:MAG: beta-lactamase family protein, partial [Bacteroidota bacterium]|nr:beta-lactamase family protein [Bacteroidota bacterium]